MHDKKALFFDTVVLSNFAYAEGGIVFLKKRYQSRGTVTLQVLEELAKAHFAGWQQFEQLEKQLFVKVDVKVDVKSDVKSDVKGDIKGDVKGGFIKTTLTLQEQQHYISLLKNLGDGEASCIAAAAESGAIVVTDDRTARNFCKERTIPVSGTIGILKAACLDGILSIGQADCMLEQMISSGFYSPVQKITDIV